MNEIFAIVESVLRRMFGSKALYFFLFCALIEITVTVLYESLMMLRHEMLMIDVSLLISFMAALLSVLTMAFDIPKELKEGTAATLLAKPLGRTQYLLGKYIGTVILGLFSTGVVCVGFIIIHSLSFPETGFVKATFMAHLLSMSMVLPMAAIVLLFSSLLRESFAAILSAICILMLFSADKIHKVNIVYGGIIPDLNLLNLRAEASHMFDIPTSYVAMAALWALMFSVGFISFAGICFNRRDLH